MIELLNMDCMDYMMDQPDNSFDYVLTSPPYNRKRNDKYDNYHDSVDNYYEWMVEVIDELIRITKNHVFFNIQKNFYNKQDVFKLFGHYAGNIQEVITWVKKNPMPASGNAITNATEQIIVFGDTALKSNSTYIKNVIETSVCGDMPKEHKAVMHMDVANYIINYFTEEEDIIFDSFSGMATTAIVCKNMNRGFVGTEIDKKYHDLACNRFDMATRQKVLI